MAGPDRAGLAAVGGTFCWTLYLLAGLSSGGTLQHVTAVLLACAL